MTEPYKIALAFTRLAGALNLVAGAFLLLAFFVLLALAFLSLPRPEIAGAMVTLLVYAIVYIAMGTGTLLLSKPVARFAVKVFAQ